MLCRGSTMVLILDKNFSIRSVSRSSLWSEVLVVTILRCDCNTVSYIFLRTCCTPTGTVGSKLISEACISDSVRLNDKGDCSGLIVSTNPCPLFRAASGPTSPCHTQILSQKAQLEEDTEIPSMEAWFESLIQIPVEHVSEAKKRKFIQPN